MAVGLRGWGRGKLGVARRLHSAGWAERRFEAAWRSSVTLDGLVRALGFPPTPRNLVLFGTVAVLLRRRGYPLKPLAGETAWVNFNPCWLN
jgi:hypothetical protein